MLKVILRNHRHIHPFNEEARDLRILNKPLWLLQRDLLAPYTTREIEVQAGEPLPALREPMLVHADNLTFDKGYIQTFVAEVRRRDRDSGDSSGSSGYRAAFSSGDLAFTRHALPLSTSYTRDGDLYLADLWYYPEGPAPDPEPVVIDFQSREIGYYHVPTYMATDQGDLVFQVPLRSLLAIDCWVHVSIADIVFGLFSRGARFEDRLARNVAYNLKILWRALLEQKQMLACSELVKIGRNCVIDPSAVIHGPTTIGDNVTIGAGAVIDNCIIGDRVNISQGCHLMLSVVGDGAFLPFRASLFMTTLMDNSMVAQNACLQMCVIGRNTFIGAGNTFTDYNLLPAPIRALAGDGALRDSGQPVLGGCVGHNCRIGSGLVIYPARTIESDVVLAASPRRRVIDRNVTYEESDHHQTKAAHLHRRLYPRKGEETQHSW